MSLVIVTTGAAGVTVLPGPGATVGDALVADPRVDKISFTGDSSTGSHLLRTLSPNITRISLELGGKSAAIVFDDADLDTTVPTLLGVSVIPSSGQSCVCQSRFLVSEARHDELVERLVAALADVKVGDPHDLANDMGPVITEAHRERILGMIRRAVDQGATVAFGGGIPEGLDKGWYVEPTLLTGVTPDMEIAQEEVFGPVVAVISYKDEADAIRIANDSRYGLAGSVYTSDVERGFAIARKVRTGTFSVNSFSADFNSPFGGFKESGIGREHGVAGLEGYLIPKSISVDPSTTIPESIVQQADVVTFFGVKKGA